MHVDGMHHAVRGGCMEQPTPTQGVETQCKEAGGHSASLVYAWVVWAMASLAVTIAGTVIWVVSAQANGINLDHAKAMVPAQGS